MGYTTEFSGSVHISPPLNSAEIAYINAFSGVRHMDREKGIYYVNPGADGFGQDEEGDIRNYNEPGAGVPGLWCQWVVSDDGTEIEWDGGEKFYHANKWMTFLIDHFLVPSAKSKHTGDKQFAKFTFDHIVNGRIDAQGESQDDMWRISVEGGKVSVLTGTVTYA